MSRDTSGRYTLGFIIFGFIASLLLIFGAGFYSLAKKLGQDPVAPAVPTFPLSAADFEPFTREPPALDAQTGGEVGRPAEGARLERPLRLGAPVRGSLVAAALIQAEDAGRTGDDPRPTASVEWVRLDARLDRYAALARGEVDLIWDTLGSLAEELPRLSALGLEARVVMWIGAGDPGDHLLSRTAALPKNPAHWAVVEAFGPAHLIALEQLTQPSLSEAERGARSAGLEPVGSPAEARAIFERGDAWAVGLPPGAALAGQVERAKAPFLNVEVLVAHPRLMEEAPASLAALLERWQLGDAVASAAQRASAARVFGLEAEADLSALAAPIALPDLDAQRRFFAGAGTAWMDASARLWAKLGLMRKTEPSARWFDGRYLPPSQEQGER